MQKFYTLVNRDTRKAAGAIYHDGSLGCSRYMLVMYGDIMVESSRIVSCIIEAWSRGAEIGR